MEMKVERKIWNMVRILSGSPPSHVAEQYEEVTNLILSYGGRIHGSQHSLYDLDGTVRDAIAVYFELPIENKEAFLKEEKQ
jgi:hypothetical protein